MPSNIEDILRNQFNLDEDAIKRAMKGYVSDSDKSVTTPLASAGPTSQLDTQQSSEQPMNWWEQTEEIKKPEQKKEADWAALDFLGNTLWGLTSSATMGLAEFSPDLKEKVGLGVVDDFMQESGWGMTGRALGEAAGFMLPLGYIAKGTKGVVKLLSGASTKNLAKKATDTAVEKLVAKSDVAEPLARKILGEAMEDKATKKFVNEISTGLKASDAAVSESYELFHTNIGKAFNKVLEEGTKQSVSPKLVTKYTKEFMDEFIGPDKRHINGIAQWFENKFNVHGNEGLKRLAGKYLGKAAELSTDFMIYNQVTSAIESWRTGHDYDPIQIGKHTLAFSAVLPFIEMIPGGKSALAGTMKADFKAVRAVMGNKVDYKKLTDDEVAGLLKIVTRNTELETSSIAQHATRYNISRGKVPRDEAIKIIKKGQDVVYKDLGKIHRKEIAQDIVESTPRMVIGALFFNSDLVTNADLWKNTSPQELATHMLIGAWFMRRRGLPISQEKMAKSHVTGSDFNSKLLLARQFGYNTHQIKYFAAQHDVTRINSELASNLKDVTAVQEVAHVFSPESDLGKKMREESGIEGKGYQGDTRDLETMNRQNKLSKLWTTLIRPMELSKKGDVEKKDIIFENLTNETINRLYENISKIKSPEYDFQNKPILDNQGKPTMRTLEEIGLNSWDMQLFFNKSKGFMQSQISGALQFADLAGIKVIKDQVDGKYIFEDIQTVGEEHIDYGEFKWYSDTIRRLMQNNEVKISSEKTFEVRKDTFSKEQKKEAVELRERIGQDLLDKSLPGEPGSQNYSPEVAEAVLWEQAEHNEKIRFLEFTYRIFGGGVKGAEGLSEADAGLRQRVEEIFGVGKNGVFEKWSSYKFEMDHKGNVIHPLIEEDYNKLSKEERAEFDEIKIVLQKLHELAKVGKPEFVKERKAPIKFDQAKSLVDELISRGFYIPHVDVLGGTRTQVAKRYFWKRALEDTNVTAEAAFSLEQLRSMNMIAEENGQLWIANRAQVENYLQDRKGEGLTQEQAYEVGVKYDEILKSLESVSPTFLQFSDKGMVKPEEGVISKQIEQIYEATPRIFEAKLEKELGPIGKEIVKIHSEAKNLENVLTKYKEVFKDLVEKEDTKFSTNSLKGLEGELESTLKNNRDLTENQHTQISGLKTRISNLILEIDKMPLKDRPALFERNLLRQYVEANSLEDGNVQRLIHRELNQRYNAKQVFRNFIETVAGGSHDPQNRGKSLEATRKLKGWFYEQLGRKDNIEQLTLKELYTEYITSKLTETKDGELQHLKNYIGEIQHTLLGHMTVEQYRNKKTQLADKYKEVLSKEDMFDHLSLNQFAQKFDPENTNGLRDKDGNFHQDWRDRIHDAKTDKEIESVQTDLKKLISSTIESKLVLGNTPSSEVPKLVELELKKFDKEFPVMQLKIKGRTLRKAVRVEIYGDKVLLVKDEKSTMTGSKDDFMRFLLKGGIRSYDLYDSVFYGSEAKELSSIEGIDAQINKGIINVDKIILKKLQRDEPIGAEELLGVQRGKFGVMEDLGNPDLGKGNYLRVELGLGNGILINKNVHSMKGLSKLFQTWYEGKESELRGTKIYKRFKSSLEHLWEKSYEKDVQLKDSEIRVMARMMYYDKINSVALDGLFKAHGASQKQFDLAQAALLKYVHLSEAELYPRANRTILESMLVTEFDMGNGRKVQTGISRETREAIDSVKGDGYKLKSLVLDDEPLDNKNLKFALNARGQVSRGQKARVFELGEREGWTWGGKYFVDASNKQIDPSNWTKAMKLAFANSKINEKEFSSLDSSILNGQTYLSERAARVIFSLLGKDLVSGHGSVKPTISHNDKKLLTTLIGKTNFVYDKAIAKHMKENNIDILMGKSVAKSFSGEALDISNFKGFKRGQKEWSLSEYLGNVMKKTRNSSHNSRLLINIEDIHIGPAAKEHGGAFLPSIFSHMSSKSQEALKKQSRYAEQLKIYSESRIKTMEDGIGMADFLANLSAEEYHSMQTGSFGAAARLVASGVDATDPLIRSQVMDWHHSRFIEGLFKPHKGAIGASSVSRASVDNYDPLYETKDFGNGEERRQIMFGETTLSRHVGEQKYKKIEDIAMTFELDGRDIMATYHDKKWRFMDPENANWKIDRKANKNALDEATKVLDFIRMEMAEDGIQVRDVFDWLQIQNEQTKYIDVQNFGLLSGVYRIPRAHMSDIAINRIRGFGSITDGNTQTVNALELATKHQADHDVDKFNTVLNMGHATFRDLYRKAGVVIDAYPEKGTHLKIDMLENDSQITEKAGTSITSMDGVGLNKLDLVQARKLTGQIVKLQGTLTYLTNLKTNAFGKSIADMIGIDGKSIGQRLNNVIQSNLDIYKGMSALSLMKNRALMRYVLFNDKPQSATWDVEFKGIEEHKFGADEYVKLFDLTNRVEKDAVLELVIGLGQMSSIFSGTYENGTRQKSEFKQIQNLYRDSKRILEDPTSYVVSKLAYRTKQLSSAERETKLRELVKVFWGFDKQKDQMETIDKLRNGEIPTITSNLLKFDFEPAEPTARVRELMKLSHSGTVIESLGGNSALNGGKSFTGPTKLMNAIDFFSTRSERNIDLLSAFGPRTISDKEPANPAHTLLDRVTNEAESRYKIDLKEEQHLTVLAEVLERDLRYASENYRAAQGDNRKTDYEIDILRSKVRNLSTVKNFLDHKFLDRVIKIEQQIGKKGAAPVGARAANIQTYSMHKDDKNSMKKYKPTQDDAVEYIYEIRTTKAKNWKELQETKGDKFLEDLLVYQGAASSKYSVDVYKGKRYAILKNPIKIRHLSEPEVTSGKAMSITVLNHFNEVGDIFNKHAEVFHSSERVNEFMESVNNVRRAFRDVSSRAHEDAGEVPSKAKDFWGRAGLEEGYILKDFFRKYGYKGEGISHEDLTMMLLDPTPVARSVVKGGGVVAPFYKLNRRLFNGVIKFLGEEKQTVFSEKMVKYYADQYRTIKYGVGNEVLKTLRPVSMYEKSPVHIPNAPEVDQFFNDVYYGTGLHRGPMMLKAPNFNINREKVWNVSKYGKDAQEIISYGVGVSRSLSEDIHLGGAVNTGSLRSKFGNEEINDSTKPKKDC